MCKRKAPKQIEVLLSPFEEPDSTFDSTAIDLEILRETKQIIPKDT
jgi:hypothetical protein